MRVAIIANPQIPIPPNKYGGIENVIFYLIKGLKERGHEPILLGTGDSKVDCPLVKISEDSVYFPRTNIGLAAYQRRLAAINRKTTLELRKLLPQVDIIHSHGFDLLPFKDFPNLTTVHGMIDFEQLKYYEDRKELYYTSISKNQQRTFPSLKWVSTVYNGEDPELFRVPRKPEKFLFFMGRFDDQKRPHHAIQLALALKMKIKVAGKVDFQGNTYFRREIKPLLKNKLVEFLGEVNLEQKIQLLSRAAYNLHPIGWREPFGLNVLEAAYAGTPTIAAARGSMPELISHKRTGLLVEDFVEAYHTLGDNLKLDREYIADQARETYNYKNMTAGYIKAYKKILQNYDVKANWPVRLPKLHLSVTDTGVPNLKKGATV